ncbi:MAG: hypothetical protein JWN85_284 [Gammaproteobacteria bacterium]|nr:hypothetical protein [Gammaproteobacteria bacterium]
MRSKQRGITAIGWLILLVPLAIVFYAGIRLAPIYLNYMKLARSLDQTASENKAEDSQTAIKTSLSKHFEIESLDYPDIKDVKITREGKGWNVEASYDDQAPLFANIAILVVFDKKVRIGGSSLGD